MVEILLSAVVALLGLILLSLWFVLYQLVKQQGRMLLRLDDEGQAEGQRVFPYYPRCTCLLSHPKLYLDDEKARS
jgi:hypothetical protein